MVSGITPYTLSIVCTGNLKIYTTRVINIIEMKAPGIFLKNRFE